MNTDTKTLELVSTLAHTAQSLTEKETEKEMSRKRVIVNLQDLEQGETQQRGCQMTHKKEDRNRKRERETFKRWSK